jgi:RNA polymerase sigma-70 factor (ECF subfamily)
MSEVPSDKGFWARLLKRVRRATRGRQDAEDLLHSAYVRLERYRAQNKVDNPAAFLVSTAVNIGVDRHRHERHTADEPIGSGGLDFGDPGRLPDEVLAARERLKRVNEGLAQLSPRTRDVFLMHRLDGMKYREIADRLGISQSAVEKHIAKAALFLTEWTEGF